MIDSAKNAKAFVSYASEHESLAKFIRDFIGSYFPNLNPLFISGSSHYIADDEWMMRIEAALVSAKIAIVLASKASLQRQWVNFEIGAVWARKIPIVFLCHSGVTKSMLPLPYRNCQALDLSVEEPVATLHAIIEQCEIILQCHHEKKFSIELLANKFSQHLKHAN